MYRFYRFSCFINQLPGLVPIIRTSLMTVTRTPWLPFKKRIILVNYLAHHLTRSPKKIVQLQVPCIDVATAAATTTAPQHFKMSVDMRYSLARRLFYVRHYEPATSRIFAHAVANSKSVIDVGANIGYYTLMAARLMQNTGGKVFAFEPITTLAKEIEASVRLNGFSNVEVFNKAVGTGGSMRLLLPEDDWTSTATSSAPQAAYSKHTREVTVESPALDDLIANGTIDFPDFIKIDAEGAEPQVLAGLRQTLSREDGPDIICEVLPDLPDAIDGIFRLHGYKPYRITKGGLQKVAKIEYAGSTNDEDFLLDYLLIKRPERLYYWKSLLDADFRDSLYDPTWQAEKAS